MVACYMITLELKNYNYKFCLMVVVSDSLFKQFYCAPGPLVVLPDTVVKILSMLVRY